MRSMEIDWTIVKKMTLWNYEDLTKKIQKVLSYRFIQEHYNHNMKEAAAYAQRLLGHDQKYEEYISEVNKVFKKLDSLRIANYSDLMSKVENRDKCEEFVRRAGLPFQDLISTLNYIFRWVLPFRNVYLRQLVDEDNEAHMNYIKELSRLGIRFNLDILEHGRTKNGRDTLSRKTNAPETFIVDLVNRADLTRLPYMNRKTVAHLSNAGYDSINKIARVDVEKLEEEMRAYFRKRRIRLGSFIDIAGLAQWARTTPKIVEN